MGNSSDAPRSFYDEMDDLDSALNDERDFNEGPGFKDRLEHLRFGESRPSVRPAPGDEGALRREGQPVAPVVPSLLERLKRDQGRIQALIRGLKEKYGDRYSADELATMAVQELAQETDTPTGPAVPSLEDVPEILSRLEDLFGPSTPPPKVADGPALNAGSTKAPPPPKVADGPGLNTAPPKAPSPPKVADGPVLNPSAPKAPAPPKVADGPQRRGSQAPAKSPTAKPQPPIPTYLKSAEPPPSAPPTEAYDPRAMTSFYRDFHFNVLNQGQDIVFHRPLDPALQAALKPGRFGTIRKRLRFESTPTERNIQRPEVDIHYGAITSPVMIGKPFQCGELYTSPVVAVAFNHEAEVVISTQNTDYIFVPSQALRPGQPVMISRFIPARSDRLAAFQQRHIKVLTDEILHGQPLPVVGAFSELWVDGLTYYGGDDADFYLLTVRTAESNRLENYKLRLDFPHPERISGYLQEIHQHPRIDWIQRLMVPLELEWTHTATLGGLRWLLTAIFHRPDGTQSVWAVVFSAHTDPILVGWARTPQRRDWRCLSARVPDRSEYRVDAQLNHLLAELPLALPGKTPALIQQQLEQAIPQFQTELHKLPLATPVLVPVEKLATSSLQDILSHYAFVLREHASGDALLRPERFVELDEEALRIYVPDAQGEYHVRTIPNLVERLRSITEQWENGVDKQQLQAKIRAFWEAYFLFVFRNLSFPEGFFPDFQETSQLLGTFIDPIERKVYETYRSGSKKSQLLHWVMAYDAQDQAWVSQVYPAGAVLTPWGWRSESCPLGLLLTDISQLSASHPIRAAWDQFEPIRRYKDALKLGTQSRDNRSFFRSEV